MKKAMAVLYLVVGFFLPSVAQAQKPAPPDVPISHISIVASFSGYDSNGKMVPANNDVFSVALIQQKNGNGFNVGYQHIQVPSLSQRWELGLVTYHGTVPKIKAFVFDTSNFVYAVSAGAGKFLSGPDGNHVAWTVSGSLNYPIAGHMAWQVVNYQYVYALGTASAIHGTISSSQVTTGPVIYF